MLPKLVNGYRLKPYRIGLELHCARGTMQKKIERIMGEWKARQEEVVMQEQELVLEVDCHVVTSVGL